ncbi:MAG: hypothetical protein WC755_03485 [Candidatus Woesearchaeota archaeon]|jgi:hypothetical protein
MKFIRALGVGILLWVLIFIEVSILKFGLKLSEGPIYYVIHYVLLAILVLFSTTMYFKSAKTKASLNEGLLVGIIFVIIGTLLDIAITVQLFIGDYSFFNNPYLWTGLVEIVIISGITGRSKDNNY